MTSDEDSAERKPRRSQPNPDSAKDASDPYKVLGVSPSPDFRFTLSKSLTQDEPLETKTQIQKKILAKRNSEDK